MVFLLTIVGTVLIVSPAAITSRGFDEMRRPITRNGYHDLLGQAYLVFGAALVIVAVLLAFHRLRPAPLGVAFIVGLSAVAAAVVDQAINSRRLRLGEFYDGPTGAGILLGALAGFGAAALAGTALFMASLDRFSIWAVLAGGVGSIIAGIPAFTEGVYWMNYCDRSTQA
jgi:hypothetical protein